MPIIRPTEPQARDSIVGVIRKGAKVEGTRKDGSTFERPTDLNYFRFTFVDRLYEVPDLEHSGNSIADTLSEKVSRLYGSEPTHLRVMLSGDDPFFFSNQVYGGNPPRKIRQCDGQTCTLHLEGNELSREPIPCSASPDSAECPMKCVPKGILRVVLPGVGLFLAKTGSAIDIKNIRSQISSIRNLTFQGQPVDIARVPLFLYRAPIQTKHGQKWALNLEVDPTVKHLFQARSYVDLMADVFDGDEDLLMLDEQSEPATSIVFRITADTSSTDTVADCMTWLAHLNLDADINSIMIRLSDLLIETAELSREQAAGLLIEACQKRSRRDLSLAEWGSYLKLLFDRLVQISAQSRTPIEFKFEAQP